MVVLEEEAKTAKPHSRDFMCLISNPKNRSAVQKFITFLCYSPSSIKLVIDENTCLFRRLKQ